MVVVTVHFDQLTIQDAAYLGAMGHPVLLCEHAGGHTAPAPG